MTEEIENSTNKIYNCITYNNNYEEKHEDLFNNTTESIAHCISADVKMGRGIAVEFKRRYGGVEELLKQSPSIGNICILKRNNKWIYYLITKELYWHKPTYKSLKSCLEVMKQHIIDNKIKSIAMPQIGCGLDKLKWEVVRKMIKEIFPPDSQINIIIYILKK